MTIVIHDTFTDAAGDLAGHVPDVAVGATGGGWYYADGNENGLVLTGTGGVTYNGFAQNSVYAIDGAFSVALPYALEFTMSGTVDGSQFYMRLDEEVDQSGDWIFVDFRVDGGGEMRCFVNGSSAGAGGIPQPTGPTKIRAEFMEDGLVKFYVNDVETYHGDINGGVPSTVSVWERLTIRIANPASPDTNVVDYLLVETLEANEVIYRDTFTGSAGTVVGHTPDVSPPSFGGYTGGLELDGSGALVNPSGTGLTSSEFETDIDLTYPFMVSLDAEPMVSGAQLRMDIEDTVGGDLIFMDCRYDNGELRIAINGGGSTSWFPGADFGTTRFRMRSEFYEDGLVKLYSTGIFQEIKTVANAPPGLHFDRVAFGINNAGGSSSLIRSASIENMPSGEAEGVPIPVIIHHLTQQGIS